MKVCRGQPEETQAVADKVVVRAAAARVVEVTTGRVVGTRAVVTARAAAAKAAPVDLVGLVAPVGLAAPVDPAVTLGLTLAQVNMGFAAAIATRLTHVLIRTSCLVVVVTTVAVNR